MNVYRLIVFIFHNLSVFLLFCLTILKNPQTNKNSKHRVHVWLLDPVSVITGCGNSHFRVLRSDLNTQTRTTHRHILIHLTRTRRPQPGVKWLSVTEVLSSETSIQILQLYHEKSLKWYQLMATKLNLRNSFFLFSYLFDLPFELFMYTIIEENHFWMLENSCFSMPYRLLFLTQTSTLVDSAATLHNTLF